MNIVMRYFNKFHFSFAAFIRMKTFNENYFAENIRKKFSLNLENKNKSVESDKKYITI